MTLSTRAHYHPVGVVYELCLRSTCASLLLASSSPSLVAPLALWLHHCHKSTFETINTGVLQAVPVTLPAVSKY